MQAIQIINNSNSKTQTSNTIVEKYIFFINNAIFFFLIHCRPLTYFIEWRIVNTSHHAK